VFDRHSSTQRASPPLAYLMTKTNSSPWLTATEAASYLKVEARTLLMWARTGKVKGFTLSGTRRHVWRFLSSDLDAMLKLPFVPCGKGAA